MTTEALLAQIAVAKYADGEPLYRQEAIYARDKLDRHATTAHSAGEEMPGPPASAVGTR
ncbi:transposase [Bradyrhizobium sp. USDA 3240]